MKGPEVFITRALPTRAREKRSIVILFPVTKPHAAVCCRMEWVNMDLVDEILDLPCFFGPVLT
jgi:hypothetical protein